MTRRPAWLKKSKPKKKPKMGNRRVYWDGLWFDSKAEAEFYKILTLRKAAGAIAGFRVKPRYRLHAGITYTPDFDVYLNTGQLETVDVKGAPPTEAFRLKARLFHDRTGRGVVIAQAVYGKGRPRRVEGFKERVIPAKAQRSAKDHRHGLHVMEAV